ncbi:MAG: glycosyltransferase family 2 protein [Solirubrobacteraceae bacterium]
MLVSAVVVNLNGRELLLACVASLETALAPIADQSEILVVDNGSRDGAPEALRVAHPNVRLLQFADNRGFPAGVNAGIEATSGDWLLLLNNDATLDPGAVDELLAAAIDRPRVGALAAQLRFVADGNINSAGFAVDRLGVGFERHIGRAPEDSEQVPTPVFGASAGAAMLRRAMLEDVGGFDSSFFLYLEDVDLAWRARMRGWECLYVPASVAHHHHSSTSVHRSPFKHFHVGRNRIRLLAKNMPTRDLLIYAPAILAYDLAYCAVAVVSDRTLMPVRGRIAGLLQWRAYRRFGAGRRHVALEPVQGAWQALARRRRTPRTTAV